jgi:hypothetical protein
MKCPACDKSISTVTYKNIKIQSGVSGAQSLHGVAYNCPLCRAILSVQADPVILNADLVAQLKKSS